ncbi:hypothetical protein [Lyngbya sp. CCY1209]|nr:hypothetical protein [Lyngbya sp. CCY1209]MEB3881928.1 hypothetical protein [Lyngbya sp. CCY1209]
MKIDKFGHLFDWYFAVKLSGKIVASHGRSLSPIALSHQVRIVSFIKTI